MSLISWTGNVKVSYPDKDDEQQALLLMLTRDHSTIELWSGEIKTQKVVGSKPVKRVKVRKQIHGSNVLIDIGIKDFHNYATNVFRPHPSSDTLISVSANGKMNFTFDQITELNLVIKEAYGVYLQQLKQEQENDS